VFSPYLRTFRESYTTIKNSSMTRSIDIEYFILFFIVLVCLIIVYEYKSILVILIDDILLININFIIKYY
jgi:hypothetical protein